MKNNTYDLGDIVKKNMPQTRLLIDRSPAQSVLRESKDSPYSLVRKVLTDSTHLSEEQVKLFSAYETAIGVFAASASTIRDVADYTTIQRRAESEGDGSLHAKARQIGMFSNSYGLEFAGYVGLALLDLETSDDNRKMRFPEETASTNEYESHVRSLAVQTYEELSDAFSQKITEENESENTQVLSDALQNIFTTWVNQFQWKTFEEVVTTNGLENVTLTYDSLKIVNGEFSKRSSTIHVDDRLLEGEVEDIIGSKEFIHELRQELIKVTSFDLEKGVNYFDPAKSVLTVGAPGCGKTYIQNILIREAIDECEKRGKAAQALVFSLEDFASHYQNKTPIMIAEYAEKIRNFDGISIIYAADVDTLFFSRSQQLSPEENKAFGAQLKMFDGTYIPPDGRTIFLMDSNYVDGIDPATKSRIVGKPLYVERYSDPADFGAYARMKILKGADSDIPQKAWDDVGKFLLDTTLSNREIEHVTKTIRRPSLKLTYDILDQSSEELQDMQRSFLDGLTGERMIADFKNYISEREKSEEEAVKKRIESQFAEISKLVQAATDAPAAAK